MFNKGDIVFRNSDSGLELPFKVISISRSWLLVEDKIGDSFWVESSTVKNSSKESSFEKFYNSEIL